jgi:hypothetical protein
MKLIDLLAQYIVLEVKDSKEELDEFSSVGGGALAGGPQLPLGMKAVYPKAKKKKKTGRTKK